MSNQTPSIYALLIGIDHYEPNRLYKSLTGAVRDINLVETFLKQTLQISSDRIHILTAPNQKDIALQEARSAQEQAPTYENIVNAFKDITTIAQPGEQVYIHYSGHGGRATTVYPRLKQGRGSKAQNDEALVPMDIGDTETGRYLRDVEIAMLLKRMTDKGLIVTMTLDCCHSGGATRGAAEIRSGVKTDTLIRTGESLVATRKELERNWREATGMREVSVAGLPQSRQYVVLAACRPNEYAYEYSVNGGTEKNGALTYWMIDTLTSAATSGQPLTYKLLHDRINAQIQSRFSKQMPMVLGESDRLVFGCDQWSTPFTVSVIKVISDGQITLNAGQAQGLSKGSRFSIYPLNTTDFSEKEQQVAIAELTQVEASESTARVLKPEEGGIEVRDALEPGAPAIMVSAPVELIQRVRLVADKIAGEQEHELPLNLVYRQREAMEKIRQALAGNGWIVEAQAGESALYQVTIDRQRNYGICKGFPLPNLRPFLSIDDPAAPQSVVDRLVHLAKYQAVQSLDNASSKLAPVLEAELLTEDKNSFLDLQNPTVKSNEVVCLRLCNRGTQPLKVAVLDLEPTWEISQIAIGGMASPFFALDQGAQEDILLRMKVPDDAAYEHSKEMLKVFAVEKGLADFRWLTLPRLDELPETRGFNLESELTEAVTRGEASEEINPLNHLLKMIGADWDKAPSATRSASVVVDSSQEWMTKQIQILVER